MKFVEISKNHHDGFCLWNDEAESLYVCDVDEEEWLLYD